MKKRINFHFHKTWNCGFFRNVMQIAILPSITITYNPEGCFIETGVTTPIHIVNFSFLFWEFGFSISSEL